MNFVFPSNFVYWNSIPNHQEIKEKYYNKLLTVSKNWDNNPYFYTNFTSSFRDYQNTTVNEEIKRDSSFLQSVIWNPIDKMLSDNFFNGIIPEYSELSELWFNVYKPGESQEVHEHNGYYTNIQGKHVCSSYSGIYILHSEESNKTVFYQPAPCPGTPVSGSVNYKTDHIEEGNVIIFPSTLLHYVLPCEKSRVTIAFNILSTFNSETKERHPFKKIDQ